MISDNVLKRFHFKIVLDNFLSFVHMNNLKSTDHRKIFKFKKVLLIKIFCFSGIRMKSENSTNAIKNSSSELIEKWQKYKLSHWPKQENIFHPTQNNQNTIFFKNNHKPCKSEPSYPTFLFKKTLYNIRAIFLPISCEISSLTGWKVLDVASFEILEH